MNRAKVTYHGREYLRSDLLAWKGLSLGAYYKRLRSGLTPEEALDYAPAVGRKPLAKLERERFEASVAAAERKKVRKELRWIPCGSSAGRWDWVIV